MGCLFSSLSSSSDFMPIFKDNQELQELKNKAKNIDSTISEKIIHKIEKYKMRLIICTIETDNNEYNLYIDYYNQVMCFAYIFNMLKTAKNKEPACLKYIKKIRKCEPKAPSCINDKPYGICINFSRDIGTCFAKSNFPKFSNKENNYLVMNSCLYDKTKDIRTFETIKQWCKTNHINIVFENQEVSMSQTQVLSENKTGDIVLSQDFSQFISDEKLNEFTSKNDTDKISIFEELVSGEKDKIIFFVNFIKNVKDSELVMISKNKAMLDAYVLYIIRKYKKGSVCIGFGKERILKKIDFTDENNYSKLVFSISGDILDECFGQFKSFSLLNGNILSMSDELRSQLELIIQENKGLPIRSTAMLEFSETIDNPKIDTEKLSMPGENNDHLHASSQDILSLLGTYSGGRYFRNKSAYLRLKRMR